MTELEGTNEWGGGVLGFQVGEVESWGGRGGYSEQVLDRPETKAGWLGFGGYD